MTRKPRILILGGTGVFGNRLARHLARWDDIALILTARSAPRARDAAAALGADVQGIALAHGPDLAAQLKDIAPFAVIDCSGPFQRADYATARAVLEAGAHLIDLADARDYLSGYRAALDMLARRAGLCALAGASSTPALSSAVVADLTQGWHTVQDIDLAITPGGRSEVGQAVIDAVLSYAGRSVPTWEQGRVTRATGWQAGQAFTLPHLGHRAVAPVETFDAELLGPRHNVQGHVRFYAGLESRLEQLGLNTISWLRARHLFPDPAFLAPALCSFRRITRRWMSDRGAMMVQISGVDARAQPVTVTWSLLAEQDHGPFVPVMAAAAALHKLLHAPPAPGARLACDALSLDEITAEMGPYALFITTRISDNPSASVAVAQIEASLRA